MSLISTLLVLTLLGSGARAEAITPDEQTQVVRPFLRELAGLSRKPREQDLAAAIRRLWEEDSILLVPVGRTNTECYHSGITAEHVRPYEEVSTTARLVVSVIGRLPDSVRAMLRGTGFYLSDRDDGEEPALVTSPYRSGVISGNKVYRHLRRGLVVPRGATEESVARCLGMVIDLRVSGPHQEFVDSRNRIENLQKTFREARARFVSEMHSEDGRRGYVCRSARGDAYWDVGEHFRFYLLDRRRFRAKTRGDIYLDYKLRYYDDLFAFRPRRPHTPRLDKWSGPAAGAMLAPRLSAESILKRVKEEIERYRRSNRPRAEEIMALLEKRDILVVAVRRGSGVLYTYGLRLEDIVPYTSAQAGVEVALNALKHLPVRVLDLLRGSGVYVSTAQGRSYAMLSPFLFNRDSEVLRNLRHGFILDAISDREYDAETATHEIGHAVDGVLADFYGLRAGAPKYARRLTRRRQAWIDSFSPDPPGNFLTEYARSNALEDFAECFAGYVHRRKRFAEMAEKNEAIAWKFAFMIDLFGGESTPPGRLDGKRD